MAKRDIGPWRMPVELRGDEGRDKLRKAAGRSIYPVIRGLPNGVTRIRFVYTGRMKKIVRRGETE